MSRPQGCTSSSKPAGHDSGVQFHPPTSAAPPTIAHVPQVTSAGPGSIMLGLTFGGEKDEAVAAYVRLVDAHEVPTRDPLRTAVE